MPFGNQLMFQFEVILNNSVVNHHNLAAAIAMRMRILFRRTPMCGPARVPDPVNAFQRRRANGFFQIVQLARRAANLQLAVLLHHRNSGGIIAAIFQALQPLQNQRHHGLGANVADNSAHESLLLEAAWGPKLQAAAPILRLAHRSNQTTAASGASAAGVTSGREVEGPGSDSASESASQPDNVCRSWL